MTATPAGIFVRVLLDRQESIAVLDKHRTSLRKQQTVKRFSPARDRLIDALWDGMYHLMKEAEDCAEEARIRGQLLYCWAGTKVDLSTT